ncbi:CaiB/BaiF CoA transferase family protein [Marinovum algicola]|uniref:CaiB/BaiF CoA transferase family protein n=1 Tax=Marinovum algicola TaxID=42444 RepID=UPI003B5182E0
MFDRELIESLPCPTGENAKGPLSGLRVLDLTHYLAGPLASMFLADLGATVVKIESPGGDRFRSYPPHDENAPDEGAAYLWANRNKLGMEIDLKHPEGKKAIHALLTDADVLIENFATGVMKRLGLDYEAIRQIRPSIVYCSVSAYGKNTEFANRPGFDSVVQAESGFVSMNGHGDRDGVRSASSVMDIATALFASNAVLAALVRRQVSGDGCHVEVPLFGSALSMTGYAAMQTLCRGTSPERHGNTSPDSCPTGVFRCRDASFFLHCGNSEIFARLFRDVVERDDIAASAEYKTGPDRLRHREKLFEILEPFFLGLDWDELKSKLSRARIPAGKVRDLKGALLSGEAKALGLVAKLAHPQLGWVPNIQSPMLFDGRLTGATKAAPMRGQDTWTVLKELAGYSETDIDRARQSGAFDRR